MTDTYSIVRDFLYREARHLDDAQWDQWLELYSADARLLHPVDVVSDYEKTNAPCLHAQIHTPTLPPGRPQPGQGTQNQRQDGAAIPPGRSGRHRLP